MIPIAIQTLDRPDYLSRTLKSLEKSGVFDWCSNMHVFDCGSSSDALAQVEYLCLSYDLELHKSPSGRLQLHEGVARIDAVLGEDFIRLEDDILVCKNWYPYVVIIMNSLEDWELINFYYVGRGQFMFKDTSISNVYRKGWETHYGICLVAFKHGVVGKINKCKQKTNEPFDIAMSLECGWYGEGTVKKGMGSSTLCVHTPSLVQHIGNESKEGAVFHEAVTFVGEGFNVLEFLNEDK